MRRAEFLLKLLLLNDSNDPLWNQTLEPVDPPETAIVQGGPRGRDEAGREQPARGRRGEVHARRARRGRGLREGSPEAAARPRGGLQRAGGSRAVSIRMLPKTGFWARRSSCRTRSPAGSAVRSGRSARGASPTRRSGSLSPCPSSTAERRGISRSPKRRGARPRSSSRSRSSASRSRCATRSSRSTPPPSASTRRRPGRSAAEAQLRAEKERYDVGLSTNFFVLTRQNDLALAVLTETAALTDYRKALTDFARASGTLLDERRIEIRDDAPAVKAEGGK